jgi:hypothetical protein
MDCVRLDVAAQPSLAAWLQQLRCNRACDSATPTLSHDASGACGLDGLTEAFEDNDERHIGAGVYEVTVRLLTGRTHQVRAQLAAVGCALVGDVMYGSIQGVLVGDEGVMRDAQLAARVQSLPVLNGFIGLHAWRLKWQGHQFCAPAPWHEP